jgi:alpha-methylacyl-CoA racemase
MATGPLAGLRVLEFAAIGPVPHAAMIMADLGADVVRLDRPGGSPLRFGTASAPDTLLRGRRRVLLDLKSPSDVAATLDLVEHADVLLEGLRPAVMERLGLGPDECLARNPRLVYGRMTGWGQEGPLADTVGHDINYISVTGVLHATGRADTPPAPPLNVIGDLGGGSMLLIIGVLSALYERAQSGRGQVVDAAMIDGTALLAQFVLALRGQGLWTDERQANMLDGGAPFYDTYACADGRFVAVGALEARFFQALVDGLGITDIDVTRQLDRSYWPHVRSRLHETFARLTRDEWIARLAGTEACVTPVLSFGEAMIDPHLTARQTYTVVDGITQAAAAPRFSRTPGAAGEVPAKIHTAAEVLARWQ